jgi:hypothetical protein
MSRKRILLAAIVLTVFCLGIVVGRRAGRPASSLASPSFPGAAAACVDFHEAGQHTGQSGCVSGRVLKVFTSRNGNTFLDFCEDYRDCPFSSLIFSSEQSKFGALQSLSGRQIEIRGRITVYQGKPEIIIHDPGQIRVAP